MVGKIHPKKKRYPCYVGVWLNAAQREKLETIAQDRHRGIGETLHLLLDNAVVRHAEFDLRTPVALTSEDTVSS
jgi:hypothetical protein